MGKPKSLSEWLVLSVLGVVFLCSLSGITFLLLKSEQRQPTVDDNQEPNNETNQNPVIAKHKETHPPEVQPSLISAFDVLRGRPLTDAWHLRMSKEYIGRSSEILRHRVRKAASLAQATRKENQTEIGVDTDEDGIEDMWVYFKGVVPAFVEADRYGVGFRDVRLTILNNDINVQEAAGWFRDPPVPLDNLTSNFTALDYLEGAIREPTQNTSVATLNLLKREMPDLEETLNKLAKEPEPKWKAELMSVVKRNETLYPRINREVIEKVGEEKLKSMRTRQTSFTKFDIDGNGKLNCLVGYTSTGVYEFRFYETEPNLNDPQEGFLGLCQFTRGKAVRVLLGNILYLRMGDYWIRIHSKIRENIAAKLFLPGYRAFRAAHWYRAVSYLRQATILTNLMGNRTLPPKFMAKMKDISDLEELPWNFSVEGYPARILYKFAGGITRLDPEETQAALLDLAQLAARRYQHEESLTLAQRVFSLADKLHSPMFQVLALETMAETHIQRGRYDRAVDDLFRTLDIESTLNHAVETARNLQDLASDNTEDKIREALQLRSHAMAVNRACKLATIAALYGELGEREKATSYLDEVRRLLNNLNHRTGEADVLSILARWDTAAGRWELARQRLTQARAILDEQRNRQLADPRGKELYERGEAFHQFRIDRSDYFRNRYALVSMGSTSHPLDYHSLTTSQLGLVCLMQALNIKEASQRKVILDEALKHLQQAIKGYQQTKNQQGELLCQLRLAEVALFQQDWSSANRLALKVRQEAKKIEHFEMSCRAVQLLGAIAQAQGNSSDARKYYLDAVEEIESTRASIQSSAVRAGFLASRLRVYEELALIAAAAKKPEEMWSWMERSKARTLLDLVSGESVSLKGPEVVHIRRDFPALFRSSGLTPSRTDKPTDTAYLDKLAERPFAEQEVASLKSAQPVKLRDVQAILNTDDLVIEYLATDNHLLAVVITKNGIQQIEMPAQTRATLSESVETFRRQIQDPGSDYQPLAKKLYQQLLQPCLKPHPEVKHVCVIPSESLHYLPFHALLDEKDRFLLQRCLVSYATSASALVYSRHRSARSTSTPPLDTFVVAEPAITEDREPLPYAALEGKRILARLPEKSKLLLGKDATKPAILQSFPARRFHFAGHTHLNTSSPLRTALLCAPDLQNTGHLEVRDLFGVNLRGCQLAVLSACETSLGKQSRGDEIVSLTRAFLRAGVPTVVASLWQVPDEPTFRLMVRFHELLDEKNTSPLHALNQAQREYLKDEIASIQPTDAERRDLIGLVQRTRGSRVPPQRVTTSAKVPHPYYWAAFTLNGDWR